MDGASVGTVFDGYSGRVHLSGRVDLGELELTAGVHRFRVTVTDRNPLGEGFKFGLDAIESVPAK